MVDTVLINILVILASILLILFIAMTGVAIVMMIRIATILGRIGDVIKNIDLTTLGIATSIFQFIKGGVNGKRRQR